MSSDHKERFIRKGLACVNTEINNRLRVIKSLLLVILLRVSLAKYPLLNSRIACWQKGISVLVKIINKVPEL
jgi:hypothetical protein